VPKYRFVDIRADVQRGKSVPDDVNAFIETHVKDKLRSVTGLQQLIRMRKAGACGQISILRKDRPEFRDVIKLEYGVANGIDIVELHEGTDHVVETRMRILNPHVTFKKEDRNGPGKAPGRG
jgi:hypothetical protein